MREPVAILGCGYTGTRVRRLLVEQGYEVVATSRHPAEGITPFEVHAQPPCLQFIPEKARILYSIPELPPAVIPALEERYPARVVYLSTTGVYGSTRDVDEHTPATPDRPEMHARVAAEAAVRTGPWKGAVLRPAAIYGPERGVHRRIAEGTWQLTGDGSAYVSRIHVDDLATIAAAALLSDIDGTWPVADDEPCPSAEIAQFCAELLGVPLPPAAKPEHLHPSRRSDRRVSGRAIRELLGVSLRYPDYRSGIREAFYSHKVPGL